MTIIYTLGRADIYEPLFDGKDTPRKAGRESHPPGGSVWETFNEAKRYRDSAGLDDFNVYGVLASWETDTAENEAGKWHDLLFDRELVRVNQ